MASKSSYYPFGLSLGLTPLSHRWPQRTGIGAQFLSCVLTPELAAAASLEDNCRVTAWYHNGPIFAKQEGPFSRILAAYCPTTAERKAAQANFLRGKHLSGTPAIVESHFGKGRVVQCSPHLEFGDIGIREYQYLLAQWIQNDGTGCAESDPLMADAPGREVFLACLGKGIMDDVINSVNWRILAAILNDLK